MKSRKINMQIKSGIDIIEVERIKSSIDEMGDNFLNRVYTENEIQYCESKKKNKYQSYAARFAVKEAAFKAISTLIKDKYSISWKNIETTNDKTGKPIVKFISLTKLLSSAICSSEIGRPSSFSDSARATQSLRHVSIFFLGEKTWLMLELAYRVQKGLT